MANFSRRIQWCVCPVLKMTPSLTLKKKIGEGLRVPTGHIHRWMQNSILNKSLIESFYIHCVPLKRGIFKVDHAEAARFYVFLRFNHDSGRKNAGMIVAPFASCLSSGNREPLFGCASRPSSLPACARAADAVVRYGDLGSRNPVHREHGARHSIDACVPPGSTTNEARLDGPGGYGEHVQVLNQAEVRIRGPGRRQQSGRKGKKSYRYSTRGMKKRFSLPDSERL